MMVYDKIYELVQELFGEEDLKTPVTFRGMKDFPGVVISKTGMNLIELRQISEDQTLLIVELLVCPRSKQIIPLSYQDDLGVKFTYNDNVFNIKNHREICIFLLGWLQVLQAYHFKKEVPRDPAKSTEGT